MVQMAGCCEDGIMSETKHTPTPWRACRIENETCIIDGNERLIIDCDRRYSSVPDAEHAANIAMIVRAERGEA